MKEGIIRCSRKSSCPLKTEQSMAALPVLAGNAPQGGNEPEISVRLPLTTSMPTTQQ